MTIKTQRHMVAEVPYDKGIARAIQDRVETQKTSLGKVHVNNAYSNVPSYSVFREHPILSIYTFALNAGGSIMHPDPYVLTPARLNFPGDVWVLGGMWAALVGLAWLGCRSPGQ